MRKLLLLASIIVLVDTSFYAAITPLLPDLSDEFGLSKTGAGLLAAAFPLGTFAGGLPGGVMAANLLVMSARIILEGNIFTSWQSVTIPVLFSGLGLVVIFSKDKRICGGILCLLIALYGAFRFLF